jgi:hypothetical protein
VLAVNGRPVLGFEQRLRDLEQSALARQDDSVLQLLREMPIDFRAERSNAMIA